MRYWIFQSKPERFDLRDSATIVPGKKDTWDVTRYREYMKPNDIVYFWMAGDTSIRGVYGWGVISSEPYTKPEWDGYGIDVNYRDRFEPHIPISEIKSTNSLQRMQILNVPIGTNFEISNREAMALALITPAGARRPDITPEITPVAAA
jgi:predicted RNA-binding protein with PUA-like domain